MLIALTSTQMLALAGVAGVFIAFALASSFLFPRINPDFPGARGVRWFTLLTVLLFASMLTAVLVFAREAEEGHGAEAAHVEGEEAREAPSASEEGGAAGEEQGTPVTTGPETEPEIETETEAEPEAEEPEAGGGRGDAAAGKAVFAETGCGGCHTFAAAGASGTVGPNLDESQTSYDEAVEQVRKGGGGMPAYEGQLTDEQIANVSAFVTQATGE